MGSNLANALPWFIAAIVILGLYVYVRSRRVGKKK